LAAGFVEDFGDDDVVFEGGEGIDFALAAVG
jgi:hypothetical protein